MIEINLLPEESRKKKKKAFQMPDITLMFLPTLIGIVAFFILVQVISVLTTGITRGTYSRMDKEWRELLPQKIAAETAKRENMEIKGKLETIDALIDKKILWSKKLNQFSDLIIPGVWFTELSIGKKLVSRRSKKSGPKAPLQERVNVLYVHIKGEVSSMYGKGLAIIGKLIEHLKSDAPFFSDFSDIELGSTNLHSIGDIEATSFNISCYFKKTD